MTSRTSEMGNRADFQGLGVASFESRMADHMKRLIERYGGRPFVAPSMREIPLQENTQALAFGEQLMAGHCHMVILLTGVGTKTLIETLRTRWPLADIIHALRHTVLVARGPKPVAALKEWGITPQMLVPEPNTWRDILSVLDARYPEGLTGMRVAVQEYGASNPDLLVGLQARGAEVMAVPVYRWALPEDLTPLRTVLREILQGHVQVLLVTNAVQIDHVMQVLSKENQVEAFRESAQTMVVGSIGHVSSERLRSYGLPVDVEPAHPKMGLLVQEAAERASSILAQKRPARS
ncbi:MAG: uroporphyrinogen-III synthase [Nitrospirae bacterium]|nr:MAG: uroporphyrinogen-III synthase [Nitrospirota bacterium]